MIPPDFWETFRPKYFYAGGERLPYGITDDFSFDKIGLTGQDLYAWQQDHPNQQYMTNDQKSALQSMGAPSGGGMMPGQLNSLDPMQRMAMGQRDKKKRKRLPLNTILGMMGGQSGPATGLGGMFGQGQ